MTLIQEDLSDGMVCPFTGTYFNASEIKASDEKRELVRQQCVAELSSSPLYQARAERNPEYWKNLSTGQANLY